MNDKLKGTILPEYKKHYGRCKNYINGEWVDSEAKETAKVMNPATDEVIAEVPLSLPSEVDAAAKAARAAFWDWRCTPAVIRARYFLRLRELLEEHFEEMARILSQHEGKEMDQSRGEIRRGIEDIEFACGIPTLMQGYNSEDIARDIDETSIVVPVGVFCGVSGFNFPFKLPLNFLPSTVACGNTFIQKPSELAPLCQQRLFELIDEVGFPPGVINMVHGAQGVAQALVEHPDVNGLGFVGSSAVGRALYEQCGKLGKRASCLCSAKNYIVVMPDANLGKTVPGLINSFYGCTGQRCLSGQVLVAVGDVYEELKQKFLDAASKVKVGYCMDETVQMGPVVSKRAKERVLKSIEKGLQEGAKLILDGRNIKVEGYPNGYFVGPTIFDEVTPNMTIAQEEIFGPVASIMRTRDLDEAIRIIDANRFGQGNCIFTSSGGAAREFVHRVSSGNIGVNIGVAAPMAFFPIAGMKDSFFGTAHGQREAMNFCTDRKVVITRWL